MVKKGRLGPTLAVLSIKAMTNGKKSPKKGKKAAAASRKTGTKKGDPDPTKGTARKGRGKGDTKDGRRRRRRSGPGLPWKTNIRSARRRHMSGGAAPRPGAGAAGDANIGMTQNVTYTVTCRTQCGVLAPPLYWVEPWLLPAHDMT